MHSAGISNISVKATEAQMKTEWPVQYTNWCEPAGMLRLLRLFYNGSLLSKGSNAFLMKIMLETDTGPNRIKGQLPVKTSVAHKTGTSDTNEQGLRAATNDVGIITLPDGRHYALAVFVSDYYGPVSKGEHLIANISRIVWDYYQAL
jgi:beta-lactamase class A